MLIPPGHRSGFYRMVAGNVVSPGRLVPTEKHRDGGYTGLVSVEQRCGLLAMAALDMDLGFDVARTWLVEAAGCYLDMQTRTGRSTGFKALRTTFRIGTCHDGETLANWSTGYLRTPYGSDRNRVNVEPENHYWHFAHALARFFAGDDELLARTLEDLRAFGPCRGWRHSADWFDAMRALAFEALSSSKPSLEDKLAAVAEINQVMFAPRSNAGFYEAWFAELAMAFVPAALRRGWPLPAVSPHPSMPLELFRLAPTRVTVRRWSELPGLKPSDQFAAAIVTAATQKRSAKRVTSKARPKTRGPAKPKVKSSRTRTRQ